MKKLGLIALAVVLLTVTACTPPAGDGDVTGTPTSPEVTDGSTTETSNRETTAESSPEETDPPTEETAGTTAWQTDETSGESEIEWQSYDIGGLDVQIPRAWVTRPGDSNSASLHDQYFYGSGVLNDPVEGYIFTTSTTLSSVGLENLSRPQAELEMDSYLEGVQTSMDIGNIAPVDILGSVARTFDAQLDTSPPLYGQSLSLLTPTHVISVMVFDDEEDSALVKALFLEIVRRIEDGNKPFEYGERTVDSTSAGDPEPSLVDPDLFAPAEYEPLARTPDDYIGQLIQVQGTILQVIEGDGTREYRIAQNVDESLIWYIVHEPIPGEVRVLEGDRVTVYGSYYGIITYDTIYGEKVSVPGMLSEAIVIH